MSNWSRVTAQQIEFIDQLIRGIPARSIPTYDELPYDVYLHKHLILNAPFLLSAKATSSWSAVRDFRISPAFQTLSDSASASTSPSAPNPSSSTHKPNLTALRRYAHHIVPVANTLAPQFSEFERSERPLGEVLDLWENGDEAGDGLYVKDWHLMAEIESEGRGVEEVYAVPECLRDDWLNPPYTPASTSDFRFTYLGPPLTYTPLHRDVYGSYSWSANVVGRKVWWLFPPDRLDAVKDRHGELVFDVRELKDEGGALKILQEEGEIIFVPSGWHHQVVNLDFCISINHNFFASPTLPRIYHTLAQSQQRVEEAIADVKEMIIERLGSESDAWEREWVDEVQGLLERDAGWGWGGFWETIERNVKEPPAANFLSPPLHMRNAYIREVLQNYQSGREWDWLPATQITISSCDILSSIMD
ncbi:hypothetical protein I316_02308 [Kwoniella heveanensis BCC8398]|uniref:JmjC domain-containing protein n=1 Tax=Kwoniella heveanensis BCC8398 TaxID=1296120 RepID=A0A1B9GXY2_9TREE|nr:hypothetical protein I316_02308 [Kwoniella heveanensis BCC8398]